MCIVCVHHHTYLYVAVIHNLPFSHVIPLVVVFVACRVQTPHTHTFEQADNECTHTSSLCVCTISNCRRRRSNQQRVTMA